jgi:HD-GYP domain-containing protein (c-di-GMP phosphodiesterase class II)
MMHSSTILIMLGAAATTIWLIYHVCIKLPREMDEQYRESLQAFSTAVELRFPSHRGLSQRVATLSKEVGNRMGLSRKLLADLEMAARLRDVGLCAIPYKMVNDRSPHSWTAEEEHAYERHSEISGAMLELVPHLNHLAPIVRHHHVEFATDEAVSEILRSQVPLESFILNAVSAYVWTERLEGPQSARAQLRDGSGTKFEPKVVATLLQVLPSQRVGANRAPELAEK